MFNIPPEYQYEVTGGIFVNSKESKIEVITFDEANELSSKFSRIEKVFKISELINVNIVYGEFSIEEGIDYEQDYKRTQPEYIGVFSNIENKGNIILNYFCEDDFDFELPFKTISIPNECIIIGVDLDENGEVENIAPLTYSTIVSIAKGCIALNEKELVEKQQYLKNSIEQYLSEFN